MGKENVPENIQLLTARLIEQDFLSKENKEKRLKQLFIDLNRSESHIRFEDKSINLQSLLNDSTRQLLEKNRNFQQLFILEITKQIGNFDCTQVEQALLFMSQDLSVPTQSMLLISLCSNLELKIHEIDDLANIAKYMTKNTPATYFDKKVYSATINSDGTVKVTSQINLSKIISPGGEVYESKNATDSTCELEFTVDLKNNSVKIEKFTIPSIVEEYRASQRESQETKELKENVKSGNLLDIIKGFFQAILNKILNIISNIKKIFIRPHDDTTPEPVVSRSTRDLKTRSQCHDGIKNHTKSANSKLGAVTQVQLSEPHRSPRVR